MRAHSLCGLMLTHSPSHRAQLDMEQQHRAQAMLPHTGRSSNLRKPLWGSDLASNLIGTEQCCASAAYGISHLLQDVREGRWQVPEGCDADCSGILLQHSHIEVACAGLKWSVRQESASQAVGDVLICVKVKSSMPLLNWLLGMQARGSVHTDAIVRSAEYIT